MRTDLCPSWASPIDRKPILSTPFALSGQVLQMAIRNEEGALALVPPAILQRCQATPSFLRMAKPRAREYLLGRTCLHRLLLTCVNSESTFVESNADRSPRWPVGFVGSITHTATMVCVAVAERRAVTHLGIDAEIVLNDKALLTVRELCLTCRDIELTDAVGDLTHNERVTLAFAAKEAFFKFAYPSVLQFFDFTDVELIAIDESSQTLRLRILKDLEEKFPKGSEFSGTYRIWGVHAFVSFEVNDSEPKHMIFT